MTFAENPRAVAGSNDKAPDYAKEVTNRLAREYAEIETTVASLLEEARQQPARIEDDETHQKVSKLIVLMRDTTSRLKALHSSEKQPYLRGGEGVDQYFFGFWDKLARRARTNRPGAADILQSQVTEYLERKLEEERKRRAEEARIAAAAAAEAQRKIDESNERARLAEEAAARARKPETKEALREQAVEHSVAAINAKAEAAALEHKAVDTHIATLAKPADLVRTRFDDGVMSTMAQEGYAEVIDVSLLDPVALWPYVSADAKEVAVRRWAKATGYTVKMAGASIGKRNKAVTR